MQSDGMNGFSTSELALGHGLLGLCPLPVTQADRAALVQWRPDLVLTLTETAEMADLGAAGLPDLLAAHAIDWLHLPIVDYDIPAGSAPWGQVAGHVHRILGQGGRVMVHCRGGCGRTGMIALRLMVEQGEEAATALTRLRTARPCAVETDQQYLWAAGPTT